MKKAQFIQGTKAFQNNRTDSEYDIFFQKVLKQILRNSHQPQFVVKIWVTLFKRSAKFEPILDLKTPKMVKKDHLAL